MRHNIVLIFQTVFLGSLLFGTGIRIPIYQGAYIYPHDGMLLAYYLAYLFVYGKKIQCNQLLLKSFCVFLGIALLSLLINMFRFPAVEFVTGAMYFIRMLYYGFLFIVVSSDTKPLEWMKKLYIVGLVFGLLGLVQFMWYPNLRNLEYIGWDPHYYRLFSTLFDPNFAGIFLVLTFFIGFLFMTKKNRISMSIIQVLIIIEIALTISRSSIVALIVGCVFAILYKKAWRLIVILLFGIGVIGILPIPNKSITPLLRQETGFARVNNWSESINLIREQPVFGHGFNLLRSVLVPKYSKIAAPLSHAGAGVDNSFLFIVLTTGIVGALGFLYVSFEVWRLGNRLLKQTKFNNFGIVFFSSLIAVCIHSLFNNSLFYPWIFLWLMILLGAGEALVRKNT